VKCQTVANRERLSSEQVRRRSSSSSQRCHCTACAHCWRKKVKEQRRVKVYRETERTLFATKQHKHSNATSNKKNDNVA